MKPRILKQADIDKEPYLIWNTFIDIVCNSNIDDLNEIQRVCN